MFWKNLNSSFHNAPSGSTIYIVFCVILIFSSTLLVLSKLIHLRHIKDADIATMKQDVKDKKRQLKLSPQNGLAIISVSLTFLQYCSLLFQSSLLPMEAKISGKLALYMGLVPPSVTYLVFLKALVTLWLIGIYYLVVVRPRILKNPSTTTKSFCPHTTTSALLNRLEPWDEFLVLYLPNFASIGFTPVVDLLLRTFDCRERREAAEYNSNFEKPFMGNDGFISSFSTGDSYFHCYTPTHYFMSLFAFVLTPLFVLAVLRYSKIFKAYRKKFDFHDKAAFVFLEPFGKLVLVVAFYNIPITFFYGLCSLLAFMTCLLLIIWQPNVYRFYDWTRAVLYGVVGILSGFFLSVELFVHEEDYSLRRRLAGYVSNVIVAFEMAIVVSVLIVFYRNLEKRDSENEAKHRKEVEDLFNAIR